MNTSRAKEVTATLVNSRHTTRTIRISLGSLQLSLALLFILITIAAYFLSGMIFQEYADHGFVIDPGIEAGSSHTGGAAVGLIGTLGVIYAPLVSSAVLLLTGPLLIGYGSLFLFSSIGMLIGRTWGAICSTTLLIPLLVTLIILPIPLPTIGGLIILYICLISSSIIRLNKKEGTGNWIWHGTIHALRAPWIPMSISAIGILFLYLASSSLSPLVSSFSSLFLYLTFFSLVSIASKNSEGLEKNRNSHDFLRVIMCSVFFYALENALTYLHPASEPVGSADGILLLVFLIVGFELFLRSIAFVSLKKRIELQDISATGNTLSGRRFYFFILTLISIYLFNLSIELFILLLIPSIPLVASWFSEAAKITQELNANQSGDGQ